jgi:hypothetical protein
MTNLSGYAETKQYAAQQTTRAGKTVYTITMPLSVVPVHLPVPDPAKPYEFNRQVDKSRAQKFADYWEGHPNSWAVPPLLLDASNSYEFEPKYPVGGGLTLGVLHLPDYSRDQLRILDGQHRILGWSLVRKSLIERESKYVEALQKMNQNGATKLELQVIQNKLDSVKASIKRLASEQVTIEIITGVTLDDHKTYFVTIADNAKGINKAERVRLDENSKTSKIAKKVASTHPLLADNVDPRSATVRKAGKDFVSLSNVADIVRHACVGITGKMSLGREVWIPEAKMLEIANHFFDALQQNVAPYTKLAGKTIEPKDLRAKYLWGSTTIIRCLAGAYFELAVKLEDSSETLQWKESGHKKFAQLLQNLDNDVMTIKTTATNGERLAPKWIKTGLVPTGSIAPMSRAQDLKSLSGLFSAWAITGEVFNPQRRS